MTRQGIVLAGIVVLDIVHIIDHWPAEETLAFIDRTEMAAGGPPHNAAAGLLQLGADFPVTLLATSGSDRPSLVRSSERMPTDIVRRFGLAFSQEASGTDLVRRVHHRACEDGRKPPCSSINS
jgi:hypothetical protein